MKKKNCTICKKLKIEKTEFRWQKQRNIYRPSCIECDRNMVKRYYLKSKKNGKLQEYLKKTKEKRLKYYKEYANKNKKYTIDRHKKYWEKNKEKYLKKRKEYYYANLKTHKEKMKIYYKKNKAMYQEKSIRYKLRKKQQTPKWNDKEKMLKIYKKAENLRNKNKKVAVDHILPLNSKFICGFHVHNNLRVISYSKNCSKKNKIKTFQSMEYYFGKNWLPKVS